MATNPAVPADDSRHYELIVDSIPHLVWVAAADGSIEYLNRKCLEYGGLPMGDLLGWDWQKRVHPEDLPLAVSKWEAALKAGTPLENECRLLRADGVYRWFVNRAAPIKDEAGRVVRWFGTCSDADDRKWAEAARRASEGLFKAIVERSYEGFALLDAKHAFRYASPSVTRILGYPPESLVGHDAGEYAHPEDRSGLWRWIDYVHAQPGERIEVWYRFRHRDGTYHRLEVRITNLLDDPDVKGLIVNFWDITDRKSVRPTASNP